MATSLLKSVPETCAVYVISKGKIQTSRSATGPQTPKSNAATPRNNSSQRTPLSSFLHCVPDFEDVIRYHFKPCLVDNITGHQIYKFRATDMHTL